MKLVEPFFPQEKRQKSDSASAGSRVSAPRKPLTQLNSRPEGLDGGTHVRCNSSVTVRVLGPRDPRRSFHLLGLMTTDSALK